MNCGAKQNQDQTQSEEPSVDGSDINSRENGNGMILTVFCFVCAAAYGLNAVSDLFNLLGSLLHGYLYGFHMIFTLGFVGLGIVLGIWMCLILMCIALKRTPENTDGLLLCAGLAGILLAFVRFLQAAVNTLFYFNGFTTYFSTFFSTVIGIAVTVGGIYLILQFLLGANPIVGKSTKQLQTDLQFTLSNLGKMTSEIGKQAAQLTRNTDDIQPQKNQAGWNTENSQGITPGSQVPYPSVNMAPFRLKTDRSLLTYILFNILTCGIYHWYFLYTLVRDINIACNGDGRNTEGLLKLILFSCLTCGIYGWFWNYKLGNRIAANAPRYGMSFQENGTTILLWQLFGALLCGIGPLVAMHIIMKNTNMLCGAYNHQHNM